MRDIEIQLYTWYSRISRSLRSKAPLLGMFISLEQKSFIIIVSLLELYKISSFFGQVVLAGDPMQLGPVIRSKLAKSHNFDLSLLERLVDMPIYARDKGKFVDHGAYNPLLVNILNYLHFSVHLHQVHFMSFVSTGMLYRQCF